MLEEFLDVLQYAKTVPKLRYPTTFSHTQSHQNLKDMNYSLVRSLCYMNYCYLEKRCYCWITYNCLNNLTVSIDAYQGFSNLLFVYFWLLLSAGEYKAHSSTVNRFPRAIADSSWAFSWFTSPGFGKAIYENANLIYFTFLTHGHLVSRTPHRHTVRTISSHRRKGDPY
jgi:hypothetical protein